MLIYVEGIDKSGKSTLTGQLSSALSIPVYRKLPPIGLDLSQHHAFFKGVGFALAELHNIFHFDAVIDRSFISDWVYTNRNDNIYPLEIWQEWENRHKNPDSVLILYIETPINVVEERLSAVPDPYMSRSDIARFVFLYDTYMKQTQFRTISINGISTGNERSNEIESIRKEVVKFINYKPC